MTPFGQRLRELRLRKGVTQQEMARSLGVSAAYLSALEHGKRGKPSFDFLQRVAGYFHIIWDEAEELFRVAEVSDPRIVVDTSGLPAEYTGFANLLARQIRTLEPKVIEEMKSLLEKAQIKG